MKCEDCVSTSAGSLALICNLGQKRERERGRVVVDNLQCVFEATGAANWSYFHILLGAR